VVLYGKSQPEKAGLRNSDVPGYDRIFSQSG
jgi:hypothetical protein